MSVVLSNSNFSRYFDYVKGIPSLGPEEELELILSYKETGDKKLSEKLMNAHLKTVVFVAKNHLGYGLPVEDLIQEGTIGLIKAIERFDPSKEVRLYTYALHYIKAQIREYSLKNYRIVNIATTKAQRKVFYNLRKNKKNQNWYTKQEVTDLAEKLNVSEKVVKQMEERMYGESFSFDDHDDSDTDSPTSSPNSYLYNSFDQPDVLCERADTQHHFTKNLDNALNSLSDRDKHIFENRVIQQNKTLNELSVQFGVSKERIRQLEVNSTKKIRNELSVVLN